MLRLRQILQKNVPVASFDQKKTIVQSLGPVARYHFGPMVKPLNKEWELFGRRYRVAGAKGDKVDCKACHKQVSASVNRLQSHLRLCPASDVGESSGASLSDAIPTAVELAEHALEADAEVTEQPPTNAAIPAENDVRPAKKQRQTPARTRDRRWNANALNVDDLWLNSIVGGPAMMSSPAQPAVTSAFNQRRLDIEEKRLELEMKRDEREERREPLNLEILEAQARKETLLAKKQEYENNVLLGLSRQQLREQGVSEDEIDRLLPIPTSPGRAAGGGEKDVSTETDETEASELQVADRVDDEML